MLKWPLILSLLATPLFAKTESGIEKLTQGNKRFISGKLEHPNHSEEQRLPSASKQEPFAIIVSCSDSRVSPELIFDQGLGDLFVVRLAGNVIGPLALDSIEYAAVHLGSSTLLVMGHKNCGAVDAVVKGTTKDIQAVAQLIEPSVEKERQKSSSNLLERSIKANAIQMKNNLEKTPTIQKLVEDKKLTLHAGYYDLETGSVQLLK